MFRKSPEASTGSHLHSRRNMFLAMALFGAVVVAVIRWSPLRNPPSSQKDASPTMGADTEIHVTADASDLRSGSGQPRQSADSSGNLPRLLRGHQHPVGLVAASGSAERLLSADTGETIVVWDYFAGEPLVKLDATGIGLRQAALSRNGKYVVACGKDPVIRMWNTRTGALAREFRGHADVVSAVRFIPNRAQFVSSSFDGSLIVWDVESGERLRQFGKATNANATAPADIDDLAKLDGHFTWIRDVLVSPDGGQAISAGNDAVLFIWDLGTGNLLNRLVGHEAPIMALALANDGRHVASVGSENVIIIWDVAAGALVNRVPLHEESRPRIAFTADGRQLAIAGDNAGIVFVEVTSREVQSRMETTNIPVNSLAIVQSPFTGDSDVVCGCFDGNIRVWPIAGPGQ